MKRLVKILMALLAIVAIAAGAGVAYLFLNYPAIPPAENVTVRATPELVARGEYLAKRRRPNSARTPRCPGMTMRG